MRQLGNSIEWTNKSKTEVGTTELSARFKTSVLRE